MNIDKIIEKYLNESKLPNAVTVISDSFGIGFKSGESIPTGMFIKQNSLPSGWQLLPLNTVWNVKKMGSVIVLQAASDYKKGIKLDANALYDALNTNTLEEFKGTVSAAVSQDKKFQK